MYVHYLVHRMKLAQERFNTIKADIRQRYRDLYDKASLRALTLKMGCLSMSGDLHPAVKVMVHALGSYIVSDDFA